MRKTCVLVLLVLTFAPVSSAWALPWPSVNTDLITINKKLKGKIVDYTNNHGHDHRIWSRTLGQRRDLYVYLPPNFDPHERYPLLILLHGMGQDEQVLLELAPLIDHSIYVGDLPPMIVAAPDGSVGGVPDFRMPATFFLNSNLGDFEDYLLDDVWDFLALTFPIRCEREAHVLAGFSMGGFAAFNIGIRHRECFGTLIGIAPPLNMRWMDDHCHYMAKFNPYHWGWRTNFDRPDEVVGQFGFQSVRVGQLIKPLYSSPDEAIVEISRNNPIELVERTCLKNGELQMYVAYGAHDEFNVTAQVESFLYLCKFKQIYVGVGYDTNGHHDMHTAQRLWPGIVTWLKPRLTTVNIPNCVAVAKPTVTRKTPPAPNPAPVQAAAVDRQPPQPMTNYFTPPHLDSKETNVVSVSRPIPGQNLPATLPEALIQQGGPLPKSPPPPSRAELGPAPLSGIRDLFEMLPPTPPSPDPAR